MLELGIDSASDLAAVAVLEGEHVLAEERWRVTSTYSKELLGGVECALLAPAGALWCGELTEALRDALDAARRGQAAGDEFVDAEGRSASDLVRLARLHRAYADPEAVDVVYLRPPPITLPASKPAG